MKLPYKCDTPVRVASPYGYRTDPITGATGTWHGGFDLVSDGDKTICAVIGGTVLYSRIITDTSNRTWEWGNYVCISGEDGHLHYYCHMAKRLVSAGDRVGTGQPIGIEGSTGRSTGSHLHYEVRKPDGSTVNPGTILGIPNIAGNDQYKEETTVAKEWWEEPLAWARENEIIYGDENGDLKLDEPCTRRQMIAFLYRLFKLIMKMIGGK